jgi:hypothetical protein
MKPDCRHLIAVTGLTASPPLAVAKDGMGNCGAHRLRARR